MEIEMIRDLRIYRQTETKARQIMLYPHFENYIVPLLEVTMSNMKFMIRGSCANETKVWKSMRNCAKGTALVDKGEEEERRKMYSPCANKSQYHIT
jgi:hypothetical protein